MSVCVLFNFATWGDLGSFTCTRYILITVLCAHTIDLRTLPGCAAAWLGLQVLLADSGQ